MPESLDPNVTAARDASNVDEMTPGELAPGGSDVPGFGPPTAPGEVGVLGPYRIVKELGRGGMGAVYAALDTRLDRRVAFKIMLPQFAADAAAKERFLREAKAAARVKHVNVVTVYEADERDGVPYIAMEFLEGLPLDAYLRAKDGLPIPQIVRIAAEAALGLAAAHKLGLVHRDVKPANLWLEAPNGTVKVLDFGLARPMGAETELTQSGAVVGTPAYMSPEQARGERVDHRTDLFSLGAVLYRLCAGRLPFSGPTTMAVLMSLGTDEPAAVREANPSVPESLAQLIHQLLAKQPEQRPQDATEVVQRLRTIAQEGTAPRTDGSVSQPRAVLPVAYAATPVAVAPEASPFADLDATDADRTAIEPAVGGSSGRRGGAGAWLAAGAAVLLAAAVVAGVVSQAGRKSGPNADRPPDAATAGVGAPPKEGRKAVPVWAPVGGEWVDVLALDEQPAEASADFTAWVKRAGKWVVRDEADRMSATTLPLLATGSYALAAEVRLDAGGELFALALPVGADRGVAFDINHSNGTARGFSTIDGRYPSDPENPTHTPQKPVPVGRVISIAVTVKVMGDRVELECAVDGEKPIRWAGPAAALSLAPGLPFKPGRFTLLSWHGTRWTVQSLKFRRLDGEAAVPGWGPPGSDPDRRAAEYALSIGGTVYTDGTDRQIQAPIDLPAGPFRLTGVVIKTNPHLSDAGLAAFAGCRHITHLDLWECGVSDAGLAHFKGCKRLKGLYLGGTKLTDAGLAHFAGCDGLETLHLKFTDVTGSGLTHFRGCAGLRVLELGFSRLDDAGLAHLKGCVRLEHVFVSRSRVTDAGLAHLKVCSELTHLGVEGNRVTDAGLAHLRGCKGLAHLWLEETGVTDAGLKALADRDLGSVLATKTKVTAEGVAALAEARPRCRIEWDGGVIEPKK